MFSWCFSLCLFVLVLFFEKINKRRFFSKGVRNSVLVIIKKACSKETCCTLECVKGKEKEEENLYSGIFTNEKSCKLSVNKKNSISYLSSRECWLFFRDFLQHFPESSDTCVYVTRVVWFVIIVARKSP